MDGTGAVVGVLSDSFNATSVGSTSGVSCDRVTLGTDSQTTSDLPPSVGNLAPASPASGLSDEGRGMMEIIHDLAPGAELMFRTAFISETDFAAGIVELAQCGADVIVDDVIYFAEPMFQDGLVAQAVDTVVSDGIPYFTSAGNQGTKGIDQLYVDSQPATDGSSLPVTEIDLHDFEPGSSIDRFIPVTLPPNVGLRLVMQWNQPFTGTLGPGAATDLDLYACSTPTVPCSAGYESIGPQGCDPSNRAGDPLEILTIPAAPGTRTYYVAVDHFCGDQTDTHFRIATYGVNAGIAAITFGTTDSGQPVFDQSQIYGHAAAAGATAVSAVDYRESQSAGGFSGGPELNVQSFSSLGGEIPFYFDGSGNPLPAAPAERSKPDISAPDGTNTSFFGSSDPPCCEGDGFPNFFGTSASAPHAAAVAALLMDSNPAMTPEEVAMRIASTARDIETPGRDHLSGHGFIDALDALEPLVQVSAADADVVELDSGDVSIATVALSLDSAPLSPVTVDWFLSPVVAAADLDYIDAWGTAQFDVGETDIAIQVQVVGDDIEEDDEQFELHLSNPVGVGIDDGIALVTIIDNDTSDTTPPTVSISDPANGSNESGPVVTIAGTAFDAGTGVDRVRLHVKDTGLNLYWDGSGWTSDWSWFDPGGTESWSYPMSLSSGSYQALAWSWDGANNISNLAQSSFS
ncbi:MAG: S8 family serine peptidase, partial [Acidimicrobiia bacterium]|nr:S8 family serine peptidase [Acidimicrobiia bacterium]